ncbi:lipoyl synthase [Iamia majanohamensis]|uniref:Multifunctional fusion protein n=2 Tax=Iamia majanohamensis TaxID=467976 RepID=A0AAE9Y8I2_9ACTN|nr:lipoyl synthase [Iamia majanohamensis]WCO68547.1 lipoyl synthase [Iamia majanohamensis]
MAPGVPPLHVRWLGRVRYRDALALQRGLHRTPGHDHLLLLEHPKVFTLGVRADLSHVLVPPAEVGAELERADRGGDVTYHGPGQLVGYPILTVPGAAGGSKPDTPAFVHGVEQLVIDALAELGVVAGRLEEYPGVWVDVDGPEPRKICAIGVRLTRGRSMHGFALNVDPDMEMFRAIVPCGIADRPVTSLRAEGVEATMAEVVDVVARLAGERWGAGGVDRADVVWRTSAADLAPFSRGEGPGEDAQRVPDGLRGAAQEGTSARRLGRLADAGVDQAVSISARKPDWMKARFRITDDYRRLKHTLRDLDLVTVCEEAGCPNIFECWADGTATFMINGERCTRACGFCLVDTRHPQPLDAGEPGRVADAVERMDLAHAVVTAVARDDLDDGGAAAFAATVRAIRARRPATAVEVLIPDCKGDPDALATIFDARPDVLNHNLETVARLQRAVRPSASYARSLAVLARAGEAGLTTKSSLIVGLGETVEEIHQALADLAAVGTDIVTVGQYLRPTTHHLPVARWWTPEELAAVAEVGEAMGIGHVEASPLTRSSYHARQAAEAVSEAPVAVGHPG